MKKLALLLALIIIPAAAFGMEMLNDSTMDTVTGQSGVSIAVDDVQLFINIDKMAYIDSDGYSSYDIGLGGPTCPGGPGALELDNFQIDVLNVNAIVTSGTANLDGGIQSGSNTGLASASCGRIPLFFNYASSTPFGNDYLTATGNSGEKGLQNYRPYDGTGFVAQAIHIDVTDQLPVLSEGLQNNTGYASFYVGGVLITLPTLEIYINGLNVQPFFTADVDGSTSAIRAAAGVYVANNNQDFGTFELDGITLTVLSGWLEIAPH